MFKKKEVKFSLDSKGGIYFSMRKMESPNVPCRAMSRDSPVVLICPQIWSMSFNLMEKGETGREERE